MRPTRALVAGVLACTLLHAGGLVLAGQQIKYGISVLALKPAALAKATTYSWTVTRPSFDKGIDERITGAVDRALQARGLRKVAAAPSDLVVTYSSLSRTDVDLRKAERTAASEYTVGTLIIDLRDPSNASPLFRVRLDTPIETDRATLHATIDTNVAAMFEKYPVPAKR